MKKAKESQFDLFSPSYAEPGNTKPLSSVPDEKSLAGNCNTDGCAFFLPFAGKRNNGSQSLNNEGSFCLLKPEVNVAGS